MWDNGAERKPILNVDVALWSLGLNSPIFRQTTLNQNSKINSSNDNKYRALTAQLIGSTWCLSHTHFGVFFFLGSDLFESKHSSRDTNHHEKNALVRCQHFILRLLYEYKRGHIYYILLYTRIYIYI